LNDALGSNKAHIASATNPEEPRSKWKARGR
jgi:hypothetical protein